MAGLFPGWGRLLSLGLLLLDELLLLGRGGCGCLLFAFAAAAATALATCVITPLVAYLVSLDGGGPHGGNVHAFPSVDLIAQRLRHCEGGGVPLRNPPTDVGGYFLFVHLWQGDMNATRYLRCNR